MDKRFSLLAISAVVLALAVPSLANGATGLTEGGALVATGKTIIAKNVGNVTFTSAKTGNIICTAFTLTTVLTENTLKSVSTAGAGSQTLTGCTVGGGGVITITNIRLNELQTSGLGTGTINMSFEADASTVTCKYSVVKGTFTYNPTETSEGGNVLTFSEVPLSVTPAACGTTSKWDTKFSLATDGTTVPVYLM
jgi:hypothetical protein